MSVDIPRVRPVEVQGDWRSDMVAAATQAGTQLATRERGRNPAIPDNFLDVSDAGFPSDIIVKAVQIPRQAVPQEMGQYRDMINRQWLHVPWSAISSAGGADGKANVPGAVMVDLGGGNLVASLAGHYLMFANRKQYEDRRALNVSRASESLAFKLQQEEEVDHGVRRTTDKAAGQLSIEDLLEYEKSIGSEPSVVGRIDS